MLFEITHLCCKYPGSHKTVLNIEHLTIPRGKIIFLLGASGSGKSTLLETLGLMNNTMSEGEILFYPLENGESVSYSSLWRHDSREVSALRKKHLSFIFQETNLMDNFTAYENICVSRMFKQDVSLGNAVSEATVLMEKVNMPLSQVGFDKSANNLSGGQRQRLAFVRALNGAFTVLFGDEPTGNLDETNGHELMGIVRNTIENKGSAIIVSHDINLALKYADEIIVLTQNPVTGIGEAKPENIFRREEWEQWEKNDAVKFLTLRERIKNLYHIKKHYETNGNGLASNGSSKVKVKKQSDLKKTYIPLFLKKEGIALIGKYGSNFTILSLILLMTLIAIGFANGSLSYLETKMKDAFVNWITISIPYSRSSDKSVQNFQAHLEDPENKTRFEYTNISMYTEGVLSISRPDKPDQRNRVKFRTFDPEEDARLLTDHVLSSANVVTGSKKGFTGPEDLSIIVTRRLLKDEGYPDNASHILLNSEYMDPTDHQWHNEQIPIPIRNIVKELPGKNLIGVTTYFQRGFFQQENNAFELKTKKYIQFFYAGSPTEATSRSNTLASIVKGPDFGPLMPDVNKPAQSNDSYRNGYTIRVNFLGDISKSEIDKAYLKIKQDDRFKTSLSDMVQTYSYDQITDKSPSIKVDQISIYFSNLDKVREFSQYIFNELNNNRENRVTDTIEVDTSKVKEKENFNFLSKVTLIICFVLILFGALSVSLFILNALRAHLNKVKMNIGTFRAMGMSHSGSRNIYFIIIAVFVLACILTGLGGAYLLGTLLQSLIISTFKTDPTVQYFILFTPITYISLAIVYLSAIIIAFITTTRILSKSPGDLIYNR